MINLINDGPPLVKSLTDTEHGYQARILAQIDGFAGEIHISVNSRRQDYNRYTVQVLEPTTLIWRYILEWGIDEGGHLPSLANVDITGQNNSTLDAVNGLVALLWTTANVIVGQSRARREDLELAQYRAKCEIDHDVTSERLYAEREAPFSDDGPEPELLPESAIEAIKADLKGGADE